MFHNISAKCELEISEVFTNFNVNDTVSLKILTNTISKKTCIFVSYNHLRIKDTKDISHNKRQGNKTCVPCQAVLKYGYFTRLWKKINQGPTVCTVSNTCTSVAKGLSQGYFDAFLKICYIFMSFEFIPKTNVAFVIYSGAEHITVSPNQSPVYVSTASQIHYQYDREQFVLKVL